MLRYSDQTLIEMVICLRAGYSHPPTTDWKTRAAAFEQLLLHTAKLANGVQANEGGMIKTLSEIAMCDRYLASHLGFGQHTNMRTLLPAMHQRIMHEAEMAHTPSTLVLCQKDRDRIIEWQRRQDEWKAAHPSRPATIAERASALLARNEP